MAHRLHSAFLAAFLLLLLAGTAHAAAAPRVHLNTVSDSGGPTKELARCVTLELQDSGEVVIQNKTAAEYLAIASITEVKDIKHRLYVVHLLITERPESVRKAADGAETAGRGLEMGKWRHFKSFQGALSGGDPLCSDIAEEIRRALVEGRFNS